MNSKYSFLVSSTDDASKFILTVLPFPLPPERLPNLRLVEYKSKYSFTLDITKPIWQIYSEDEQGQRNLSSTIPFWYIDSEAFYGQFLYSGERVKGVLNGRLSDLGKEDAAVTLDLIVDEGYFFDEPKNDDLASDRDKRKWQAARRYKRIKTQELSLCNNHGFYKIIYGYGRRNTEQVMLEN